jgi:hypothetical protein
MFTRRYTRGATAAAWSSVLKPPEVLHSSVVIGHHMKKYRQALDPDESTLDCLPQHADEDWRGHS